MNTAEDLEFAVLTKRYNETLAVNNISLKIPAGTYCCLLGPSGCGKTSTLRMIAGHEEISEGDILVFVSRSTSQFGQITKAIGCIDPELPEKPQVAIFGATQFGNKLSKHYLDIGSEVVVIEPDLDFDAYKIPA